MGHRRLHGVEGPAHVHAHRAGVVGGRDLLEAREPADAGGVDQDVEPAEGRHGLGHRRPHGLGAPDVARIARGGPPRLAEKGERLTDALTVHVDDEDLRSLRREALRRRTADARPTPGHEHDPIGETRVHRQLSRNTPRASSPRCRSATAPANSSSG